MQPTVLLGPIRWLRNIGRERVHRRLTQRGWYDLGARSDTAAIFIGGCPRSGTTLLREILARHSRLATGIETAMLVPMFEVRRITDRWNIDRRFIEHQVRQSRNVVEFADEFYRLVTKDAGKARWVDKAPANVRVVSELLTWFPRGRFINVVRDGRDVVCSLRHHPKEVLKKGAVKQVSVNNSIKDCARTWISELSYGLPYAGHPRYLELRYEWLVSNPDRAIRAVCDFVEEDFEEAMARPAEVDDLNSLPARFINNPNAAGPVVAEHVGRWRREMNEEDRRQFVENAGEMLIALGYEGSHDWVRESPLPG